MSKQIRVGFVGAGKVGCSFGKFISAFASDSASVSGYYSRSPKSAAYAAGLTKSRQFNTAKELTDASDCVFLTVPDGIIEEVWHEVCAYPEAKGTAFFHMSGSLTSEIFGAENHITGSLHPMIAIADRELSWKILDKAYYTFEGNDAAYECIEPLIQALGIRTERIQADTKILYHAACVFASNLVCGLAYDTEKLLGKCGLSDAFAAQAWKTLFANNAENIIRTDSVTALTGPVERGDAATVRKHIEALSGDTVLTETYISLTKTLAEMAARKHPERDYPNIICDDAQHHNGKMEKDLETETKDERN